MINIENLSFTYNKTLPCTLDNINLKVNNGDYISIVGENGSGKSTLIKIILGIIKPSKGTICLCANRIGYVPQKFESFNAEFPITVYEVMNCHRKALKIKNSNIINDILKKVDMYAFKNSLIGTLSGGQFQKIFIGRALMGAPELLVLDEPSTGIDLQSQKDLYSLIKRLNKNSNLTIISVEHNIKAAIENSNYILKLDKGKSQLYSVEQYLRTHQEVLNYATI